MLTAEVKTRITDQSLVTTGWTVFRGTVPPLPDKVIVLNETGGTGQSRTFGSGVVERVGLQVVVRGAPDDYDAARLQMERLYQAMSGWGAFTVTSVRYLSFTPLQAPFPRGKDENRRQEFAVNFIVEKELSATS